MPAINLKNILRCAGGRHRTVSEGRVGGERDLLRPSKGRMGGARPGAPSRARNHGEVCEVCKSPHTQVSLDLSALCEVCEVCEVLDKKIN